MISKVEAKIAFERAVEARRRARFHLRIGERSAHQRYMHNAIIALKQYRKFSGNERNINVVSVS